MRQQETVKVALIDLLQTLEIERAVPVNLYEIGPPMVAKGFTENDILHALYALKDSGIIDLVEGNRLVLIK
jgi:hypothetical protein